MSFPRRDFWSRCGTCDNLYVMKYKPTKLQQDQYSTRDCQVCHYHWLERTTVNSMTRYLKKGFTLSKKGSLDDWRELAPLLFGIFSGMDPIFVRNCYEKASKRVETQFTRLWERSLR